MCVCIYVCMYVYIYIYVLADLCAGREEKSTATDDSKTQHNYVASCHLALYCLAHAI